MGQADLRLRFTELPDEVRTALARHASVETASSRTGGSVPRTECKRCQIVFRDAQRPGLYVMGPGLMALAAYAEPDQEQRRQVLFNLWFSNRSNKTGVPASVTGPARLIHDVAQRAQTAAATMARLPAITSVSQIAANNAGLMRAVAAVAIMVIGAGMPAAPEPEPHPAQPAPPPSTALAPQTPALAETAGPQIPALTETSTTPPTTPPTTPTPAPGTPVSVVADSSSVNETEDTDPNVSPSPSAGISIDATRLSTGTFSIRPGPSGLNARMPHKVPLAIGTHKFITGHAWFSFTVSAAGLIEYRPELRSYLDGAGTSALIVKGVDITIEARQLTHPWFTLQGEASGLPTDRPHTLRLVPGMRIFTTTGRFFNLTVTAAGNVDYDPTLTDLSGRGTPSLTIG